MTADAFGDKKFWRRVVRVREQLGPENIRTDEPTERVDRRILETLVELEPGSHCRAGCEWMLLLWPMVSNWRAGRARLAVRFFAPGHEGGPECPGYIN